MKNKIKHLLLLAFIATSSGAFSQVFTVSGELRPRAEYYHGYKTLASKGQKSAFSISQRTRLNLAFEMDKWFSTYISLQDVRTWGSQSQLVANEANGVSLHEAWGEIYMGKKKMGAVKFGRQEIIYDDHRIFGNVGWVQQARSHDAVIFKYRDKSKAEIQLGFAYNQDSQKFIGTVYTVGNSYKTFQSLWIHKDFEKKNLEVSLLALNVGVQASDTNLVGQDIHKVRFTQIFGTHISYNKSKFGLILNAYAQTGRTAVVKKPLKMFGYLASADFSYKFIKNGSVHLVYEYISGTSQTKTDPSYYRTNHSFNPMFGTNHAFNGFMDYFYVGNHISNVGLQDLCLKIKYNPNKFSVGGDFHFFFTGNKMQDPSSFAGTAAKPYLGTEIDLYGGYNITKWAALKLGYSQLIASQSMEYLKGGDKNAVNNWGYVSLIVNPTFFKHKFKKDTEENE